MLTRMRQCLVAIVYIPFLLSPDVHAQIYCADPASDMDGDGWGWENHRSCEVAFQQKVALCTTDSDSDGDGWGWENNASCLMGSDTIDTDHQPTGNSGVPVGLQFDSSSLKRVGGKGDNWCQTWAADDSVITAMSDGEWFDGSYQYHSRLYRLTGDSAGFSRTEVNGYPRFHTNEDGWYAYGTLSVNGTLYSMVSKAQNAAWSPGPFRGVKMLRSYDNGASWSRVDRNNNDRYVGSSDSSVQSIADSEMFFFQEHARQGHGKDAYPFSFVSFVQNGKDHQASKDGYVYIYSPESAQTNQLMLARVPADQLGMRSAWEYFGGWRDNQAWWTQDISQRQANIYLPEKNANGEYFGWYSWLPSVVWNEGLGLYVMANGGTYGGHGMSNASHDYYDKWMHTKSGSLGLWYSQNPYGPWTQFYYTEHWLPDNPGNLTYQPKLSPKWISADGKRMTMIWSDAMRNPDGYSHSVNYKWNQMQFDIQVR